MLEPLPVQESSSGGIFLPKSHVGDQKLWWRVVALGTHVTEPGKPHTHGTSASDYQLGQVVLTPLHFSHTTLEDGSERKIVDVDQLIAVLD
jgi:co-chaperonin GroES (HSP10)